MRPDLADPSDQLRGLARRIEDAIGLGQHVLTAASRLVVTAQDFTVLTEDLNLAFKDSHRDFAVERRQGCGVVRRVDLHAAGIVDGARALAEEAEVLSQQHPEMRTLLFEHRQHLALGVLSRVDIRVLDHLIVGDATVESPN